MLYEISESLKKEVKFKTINKRVDSLLAENYTREEFLLSLKIDRIDGGWELDSDRKNKPINKQIGFLTLKEFEAYTKKMDSTSKANRRKLGLDTIPRKRKQKKIKN